MLAVEIVTGLLQLLELNAYVNRTKFGVLFGPVELKLQNCSVSPMWVEEV